MWLNGTYPQQLHPLQHLDEFSEFLKNPPWSYFWGSCCLKTECQENYSRPRLTPEPRRWTFRVLFPGIGFICRCFMPIFPFNAAAQPWSVRSAFILLFLPAAACSAESTFQIAISSWSFACFLTSGRLRQRLGARRNTEKLAHTFRFGWDN